MFLSTHPTVQLHNHCVVPAFIPVICPATTSLTTHSHVLFFIQSFLPPWLFSTLVHSLGTAVPPRWMCLFSDPCPFCLPCPQALATHPSSSCPCWMCTTLLSWPGPHTTYSSPSSRSFPGPTATTAGTHHSAWRTPCVGMRVSGSPLRPPTSPRLSSSSGSKFMGKRRGLGRS